ncbi:MAG: TatD family hydrolase [Phycisphaerae bacterium]|nr:TatD family hydrolase [Phycisphaerae bacterium]
MVTLIDSHCHLTYETLREQVGAVIDRATAAGVTEYVTVAEDLADAEEALMLSAEFPSVHVVAGVHPHVASKVSTGWDEALLEIIARDDVVAVGETGLDYHYDYSDRDSQKRVFRRQLEIATEASKPVVIHCRDAHRDGMAILAEYPRLTGVVFHCFTGSEAEAREILARGYWISLTGAVTFKKSEELRAVARMIPADQLMIETDAPFLSPEPMRQIRPNEPALLVYTAACIAEERNMALSEFAALTAMNTRWFFSLPGA